MKADPRDWAIYVHHQEALRLSAAVTALQQILTDHEESAS